MRGYFAAFPDALELVAPPVDRARRRGGQERHPHPLEMLKRINDVGLDRQSFVVVIGGGAVLDMVSFAAAIAHRGVRVVRIPTTVLAQADSGVGVKNGINLFGKKNFVGTFVAAVRGRSTTRGFWNAAAIATASRRRRGGQGRAAARRGVLRRSRNDGAAIAARPGRRHAMIRAVRRAAPRSTSAATAIRSSWAARGRSTSATGRRTSSSR